MFKLSHSIISPADFKVCVTRDILQLSRCGTASNFVSALLMQDDASLIGIVGKFILTP